MKSIFVQISSYHDYELCNTITNAIAKSSKKYKINFGIHSIYHKENDILVPEYPNVNLEISKAPENLGMGLGRLIAHNFYSGEDYYFQIDAHTNFDQDWDSKYVDDINYYQSLGFSKIILTSYPKNYWYENGKAVIDESPSSSVTYISFHEDPSSFKNRRIPSQTAMPNEKKGIFSKSVSGGNIFATGEFIKPNPKIFANGEEIFIAARAWTSGYDLLLPRGIYIHHLYYNHNKPEASKRRLVWEDYPKITNDLDEISKREIYEMLDKNVIGEYHLGSQRTLEEFGIYAGLDFKTGEVLDPC